MEKKKIKRAVKLIIIVCLVLITGYFILNAVIQKKIRQQFTNLSPALAINFSKVHADIFSSSVSFDGFDINFIPYQNSKQNKHHLYFSTVSLNGISFLNFLLTKKLEATELLFDGGSIQLDSFLLDKKDSGQSNLLSQIKWPLKKLHIGRTELRNTQIFLRSERGEQRIASADIIFDGVSFSKPGEKPSFDDIALQLSRLNYQSPRYRIELPKLTLNSNRKKLELDSLHVFVPGQNTAEITISSLRMTGFDVMKLLKDQTLVTKNLTIDKSKIALFKSESIKNPALPFDLKKIDIDNFQCTDALRIV